MIRKLARFVGGYKKEALLSPLLVSLEVVMEVLIPLLMADLIDFGVELGDMGYILKMGVALVVCCLLSLFFGALCGKTSSIASAGFAKNLRKEMFHKVQDYSFSNVDKFSSASLVTRLTTDVTNIQHSFMMIIRVAVRSPIMMIFSIVASFSINAKLATVFLYTVPLLAVGLVLIMRFVNPIFRRGFKTYDNLVVQENLTGIRVVKSFVREPYEIEKFTSVSQKIAGDFTKAERIIALNGPLMNICAFGSMVVINWLGAKLIIQSGGTAMTTGELMSMLTFVMQILMSLMMISMIFW